MTQDETPSEAHPAPDAGDAASAPAQAGVTHAPVAAGELLVTLEFHLPGKTVSLAEVAAWTEGGLVTLPETEPAENLVVTVRNGDRVIAEGHLVRLDDRFGVRIDRTFVRR